MVKTQVRELFYSKTQKSIWFNRVLLAVNVLAIFLFLLDPAYEHGIVVHYLEFSFGVFFLAEYFLRLWIAPRRMSYVFSLLSLVDLIVIVSLFAPLALGEYAFLRVARSLRILRTYRVLKSLHTDEDTWFNRNEEIITGTVNLIVFVFVMTDIVYVMQVKINDGINSYIDALYFTLTTLTTTGFGDITPAGQEGKLLAILIMVFGITLFVNLARSLFSPKKVRFLCTDCGLKKHDPDASHCKHCGKIIFIETEGG